MKVAETVGEVLAPAAGAGGRGFVVPNDEAALWLEYRRSGETGTRNELVMRYVPWAESICRGFAGARGFDWREAWGAAALALIGAVGLYDPARGVPFRSFAGPRIAGALLDAARQHVRLRRPGCPGVAGDGPAGPGPRGPSAPPTRRQPPPGNPPAGDLAARRSPTTFGSLEGPERTGEGDCAASPVGGQWPAQGERPREVRRVARTVLPAGRPGAPRDPAELAEEREARSRILDAMPDARSREVACRRIFLLESVDEIGYAMRLGKSRVQEILAREVLPRARRTLVQMGIGPAPPRRLPESCAWDIEGVGDDAGAFSEWPADPPGRGAGDEPA